MASDFRTCIKYDIIEDHALGRKGSIFLQFPIISKPFSGIMNIDCYCPPAAEFKEPSCIVKLLYCGLSIHYQKSEVASKKILTVNPKSH